VNPAVLFLVGGAGLAVVLSAFVWLFSRPKKVVEDLNQARTNLRALRHGAGGWAPARGPGAVGTGGIRVLGDVPSEEPGSGSDTGSEGR
jgi:hypothetical protein